MNFRLLCLLPARLLCACLVLFLATVSAQPQDITLKRHPGFTGRLASPEILIGLRDKLELTKKQADQIEWVFNRIKPELEKAEREHKKRDEAFHGYLENKEIDSEEAARYLDRLSKAEAAAKRLHVRALIDVNKVLTPGQNAKLLELRESGEIVGMIERGKELRERLQAKMRKYQENMKVFADLGGPPYNITEISEKMHAAMEDKNYVEVEKLLDKALAAMELK